MGEHLKKIVNVTIYYPEGIPTFFDFISGKVNNVYIAIETLPIDKSLIGDYFNDENFKQDFQQKINQLWLDKDEELKNLYLAHKKDAS
jgi:hypothetical protein